MSKRKITDLYNLKFEPFDNYGSVVLGMSWHKISYDKKVGDLETYVLKIEPGSKHSSCTKNDCLVLVFMRGINIPLEEK